MAIDCLGSVARLSAGSIAFCIHDDGSLTEEDQERLKSALPTCCIVGRKNADDFVEDRLATYPHLRALRHELVLALKLLDGPLMADSNHREQLCDLQSITRQQKQSRLEDCIGHEVSGQRYLFVDSDVLFFEPFRFPNAAEEQVYFMRDRESSYSLRSLQLARSRGFALPAKANTGIIVAPVNSIDLDFLEWFVSQPGHRSIPTMLEQTAWAALGMRYGCALLSRRQVRVMREGEDTRNLVAGHFTARTRHLLPAFVCRSKEVAPSADAVMLDTEPPGRCNAFDLARYEGRRVLSRITGWRR